MTNNIVFACFAPHPPLLLPDVGSEEDRARVEKTIEGLEQLGERFKETNPDQIIISSPHPDWGFNVPLHFLAPNFLPAEKNPAREHLANSLTSEVGISNTSEVSPWRGGGIGGVEESASKPRIKCLTTGPESPVFYFEKGEKMYKELEEGKWYALIASGDLSHRLKEDGPYGFHPDGPKFDQKLIKCLKKKDIENFLKLDETFPKAGECGLRSFSFLLGILEAGGIGWEPKILSYEGPFGVGYLVVNFKLKSQ